MSKRITLDYTNMLADAVGEEHGLTEDELSEAVQAARSAAEAVNAARKQGKLPFCDLHRNRELVERIHESAQAKKDHFDDLVVLGIGGSALGTIALASALRHDHWNRLDRNKRGGHMRLHVLDNVDPVRISELFDMLDLERTLFNVITKSGSTAETMSQFMCVLGLLKDKLGGTYKEHIVCTTDREKGLLRPVVERRGLESYVVPEGVGGRFSVMSAVGLFPAAAAGIDIDSLLDGVAQMDERTKTTDANKNPALMNAALLHAACTLKHKAINVMMPYSHKLRDVADWYRQLWAESLGKKTSRDGSVVNTGQTPVKALGVTDQHSQIQLYVEGPNDKVVALLAVESFPKDVEIPDALPEVKDLAYLANRKISELYDAERKGTTAALTAAQRPNETIVLPEVNAHAVGGLLCLLEMQTAYSGELYNINAFDQPGVEAGKIATYGLMGRAGYESQGEEILAALRKQRRTV